MEIAVAFAKLPPGQGVELAVGVGLGEGGGVGVAEGVWIGVGVGVGPGVPVGPGVGVGHPPSDTNSPSTCQPGAATASSDPIRKRKVMVCPTTFGPRLTTELI